MRNGRRGRRCQVQWSQDLVSAAADVDLLASSNYELQFALDSLQQHVNEN